MWSRPENSRMHLQTYLVSLQTLVDNEEIGSTENVQEPEPQN